MPSIVVVTATLRSLVLMVNPERKKIPHAVPQWVSDGSWFFITINCLPRGENQLCHLGNGDKVLRAAAFYHARLIWHCRLALLMPDHLHAILAFPRDPGLTIVVTQFKRFAAARLGVKWQRDFFDHRLRDHRQVQEKTAYILANPVRKGFCQRAEDWRWIYQPADRPPPAFDLNCLTRS